MDSSVMRVPGINPCFFGSKWSLILSREVPENVVRGIESNDPSVAREQHSPLTCRRLGTRFEGLGCVWTHSNQEELRNVHPVPPGWWTWLSESGQGHPLPGNVRARAL